MVSHPETGSDSPIGSDRESGRDRAGGTEYSNSGHIDLSSVATSTTTQSGS